jgi:septal ring factor EnvC (AmiA/AmiB activator)
VARAQKGRIPRRQYKVQRRALELRYDSLSKHIAELKATFRRAGGNYANLVKQLDASQTELSKIEANIRNTEARHRTGELNIEQYKQALDDLRKRREKTESTVNGILLRLREEIR